MAARSFLLYLLWLHQFDRSFVVAQVTISQRLCLWPQLETKTITCSSDGSALIFVKSIVMTRLLGGLTTCSTARANDAPELNDCRVTLGARDSYYADINRLCADKPSCNIHSNGNVAAYVGQTLCGLGMENSTIRNLVVLTLQCYAVQVIPPTTTVTVRTTTTARQAINSSPVIVTRVEPGQPTTSLVTRATQAAIDDMSTTAEPETDNRSAKVIAGASVGGAIVLFGLIAIVVWLRRGGAARCCAGLAGNKRGRFGGSGGLEPLYDDMLMDEKGGDREEGGGGRAVEQLRRMIAEEQSKQARKRSGSRAAASVSGRSAGRRHRHRSSRHVHAESDDAAAGGSGTTRRRSHHRSAGKAGHSSTASSRHGGGHRHHRRHRSHHQQKQRSSGAGRHRSRPSSKQFADGGEWRRSAEIEDDQSSIADAELLSNVEESTAAGEEATAGDEWVDEMPSLGASATAESGLSSEGVPDGDGELAKSRSGRRARHRRSPGEAKASRGRTKGAGKTGRSSHRHSSDAAAMATTTLDVSDDDGAASQPVDAGAASSRERRRHRRRQSRSLVAGVDGAVVQAEVATGVQESDGIAAGAGTSFATTAETEAAARSSKSRRERGSASRSVRGRRPSDEGGGGRTDAAPTASDERKRSSDKSERAAKASRRGERSEGRSSRHRRRDANDGEAAAASDVTAAVRGRTDEGGDERRRRRQRRVQLQKTKSRGSQKRSLRRREYEMRRNDKFLSDSSASDSDVAAAAATPSAELLELIKSQQEQRRRRLLEQQQPQSEKRGRRSKEKKSSSHSGKTEDRKRRTSSHSSAAVTGGGAVRPCNSQPLAAAAAAEVAKITIRKDAELAATSSTANVRDAAAASVSVSGRSPGGDGSLTALSHYQELSAASCRADERTFATLSHSESPLQQENSSVCARNSTIVACEFRYDTAAAAVYEEDGYHCVVVDANQNMADASVCSICRRREENCECLNSVLVDAFSHSTVAPTQFALSA